MILLFVFELHRKDTMIKCSNVGLVWGWFGVGLAWFVVGFAVVFEEKQCFATCEC